MTFVHFQIWSEDARESPIIWTSYGLAHLTGGCWSPSRPSIFFTVTMNGWLEAWDLLMDRDYPVIRAKVSINSELTRDRGSGLVIEESFRTKVVDEPLSAVKVHEGGKLVACGAAGGALALVELDDAFAVLDKNDKLLLTMVNNVLCLSHHPIHGDVHAQHHHVYFQTFDRETKRERILEARAREQRLRDQNTEAAVVSKRQGKAGCTRRPCGTKRLLVVSSNILCLLRPRVPYRF